MYFEFSHSEIRPGSESTLGGREAPRSRGAGPATGLLAPGCAHVRGTLLDSKEDLDATGHSNPPLSQIEF